MFPATVCCLRNRISLLSRPVRVTTRELSFKTASRRQFRQWPRLFSPCSDIFCKRTAKSRISVLDCHRYFVCRKFHHSNRWANQFSKNSKNDLSVTAKFKRLSREYGWSAFGIYLALSAIDFPFCYLLVNYLGAEKIGEWEQIATSTLKSLIPEEIKRAYSEWSSSSNETRANSSLAQEEDQNIDINSFEETASNSVEEAAKNHKKNASIATQLALAYAIHKTFIFVRVPLTAAITPRVVKILRGWGWDIGKRTTK